MSDSFSALSKLHSYTPPNPTFISPPSPPPEITPNPYCLCAHCTDLFSFNTHHLGDEGGGIRSSSSRWIPTPAQLLYLEQLYKQGTKTPTAQQIQLIASQLRCFGNIQAKNVFYWFQNHKARERQKRRRCQNKIREISPPPPAHDQEKDHQICVLGLRSQHRSPQHAPRQGYEVKETKKWASSSNCSALAEVNEECQARKRIFMNMKKLKVSDSLMNRAERSGAYRRTQREERETQTSRLKREESQEARCQISDMSTCFLPNSRQYHHIKSITTTTSTTITHHTQTSNPKNYYSYEEEVTDDRTLKLFPLKRSDEDEEGPCVVNESGKHKFCCFNNNAPIMDSDKITSNQFFEFLPLRN